MEEKNNKETFREYCYGKFIMSRMAEDIPFSVFLNLINEWRTLDNQEHLFWFLNSKGFLFPGKEEFLENEYQDAEYLCSILTEDEMQKWVELEHPQNKSNDTSMAYADAKALVEQCIENDILQEEHGVRVVAVHKGNMISKIISLDECIREIMQSPEGQETLISALEEKGINFERKFDFLFGNRN